MNHTMVRSALFVPANRPDRIPKALASGADRVIVDLEDAVEEAQKIEARENLNRFLTEHTSARILVRVNAAEHWAHIDDLALCKHHIDQVAGVVLPKAESATQIHTAHFYNNKIWPIIESARGLIALDELASAAGVERLTFGSLDLGLDLGLHMGTDAAEKILNQARYEILVHSRAAGLMAPLDGVYPAIKDTAGLEQHIHMSKNMGFGGAFCIHPSQVKIIHEAMQPSQSLLNWARRVTEHAEKNSNAFSLDGQMIDAPVIARAKAIIQTSQTNQY